MTSWRRLKTRWRYLFKMSLRRLQNVCKSSSPRRMFVGLMQSFGTTVMNLGHFLQVWITMSSFERAMFLDYTLLVLSLSLIWLRLFITTCIWISLCKYYKYCITCLLTYYFQIITLGDSTFIILNISFQVFKNLVF